MGWKFECRFILLSRISGLNRRTLYKSNYSSLKRSSCFQSRNYLDLFTSSLIYLYIPPIPPVLQTKGSPPPGSRIMKFYWSANASKHITLIIVPIALTVIFSTLFLKHYFKGRLESAPISCRPLFCKGRSGSAHL